MLPRNHITCLDVAQKPYHVFIYCLETISSVYILHRNYITCLEFRYCLPPRNDITCLYTAQKAYHVFKYCLETISRYLQTMPLQEKRLTIGYLIMVLHFQKAGLSITKIFNQLQEQMRILSVLIMCFRLCTSKVRMLLHARALMHVLQCVQVFTRVAGESSIVQFKIYDWSASF